MTEQSYRTENSVIESKTAMDTKRIENVRKERQRKKERKEISCERWNNSVWQMCRQRRKGKKRKNRKIKTESKNKVMPKRMNRLIKEKKPKAVHTLSQEVTSSPHVLKM